MDILAYTFRTNSFNKELKDYFHDVFVFGKLKQDLVQFEKSILLKNPKLIIGIAKSDKTRFEKIAINNFNNKLIERSGKDSYNLFVPKIFDISKIPTNSFCNYTMYRISKFIDENKLQARFSFLHLNQKELDKFLSSIFQISF
ncbi:MAG: hypothetical protein ACOYT4_05145 [Nanoarchaeota archaeon]